MRIAFIQNSRSPQVSRELADEIGSVTDRVRKSQLALTPVAPGDDPELFYLRLTSPLRGQIIISWTFTRRSSNFASRGAAAQLPPLLMYADQFLRLRRQRCSSATTGQSWALSVAGALKPKSGKRPARSWKVRGLAL